MQAWATGVTWIDPKRNMTLSRKADVYIDNTTLWTNGIHREQELQKNETRPH